MARNGRSRGVVASELVSEFAYDSGSAVLTSLACGMKQFGSLARSAPPSVGASGGACGELFPELAFGPAAPPSSSPAGRRIPLIGLILHDPTLNASSAAGCGAFLEVREHFGAASGSVAFGLHSRADWVCVAAAARVPAALRCL